MATDRVKQAQQALATLEQKSNDLKAQIQEVDKSLARQNNTMGRLVLQGGDVDKLATDITQLDAKKRVLVAAQTELERQVTDARAELVAAQKEAAQMRAMQIAQEADKRAEAYKGAIKQALAELDALVGLQVEAHALCNQNGIVYPGQSFAMAFDAHAYRNTVKTTFDSLAAQEQAYGKNR
ncbi:MAG: hypothetical protein WCF84_11465 [Anaerolineae bacterium]